MAYVVPLSSRCKCAWKHRLLLTRLDSTSEPSAQTGRCCRNVFPSCMSTYNIGPRVFLSSSMQLADDFSSTLFAVTKEYQKHKATCAAWLSLISGLI